MATESRRFYPTPSTTKYMVRGIELDDVFRVDFRRTVGHQPVYGYDSPQFGFIAKGKELVTGNIIINYRYPGYLLNVLLKQDEDKQAAEQDFKDTFTERQPISQQSLQQTLEDVDMQHTSTDKMNILANRLLEAYRAEGAATDENIINKLKSVFEQKFYLGERKENIFHLESPIDRNRILAFDMSVLYGFHQSNVIAYSRIFRDIVLTGESETVSAAAGVGNDMSSSAQPILEMYPFFCKTIETKQG